MKYKIIIVFLLILGVYYVVLSHLNTDTIQFYLWFGRYYQSGIAEFVGLAFLAGALFTFLFDFFFDVKRFVTGWILERKEKKKGELLEVFRKAKAFDQRGDREKAIENIEKLIRRSPGIEEPYLFLADLYISTKDYGKAIDVLNAASTALGRNEAVLLKKAKIFIEKKDFHPVEGLLKDVIGLNEMNFEAMAMLRDYYIGIKGWGGALDLQRRIAKYIRTPDELRRLTGIQYERVKEEYAKGDESDRQGLIKELKGIIGEDPQFIPAYLLLAELYMKTDKPNDAGRVFGRGYTKTGHVEFLLKMEDLYINRGDPGVILKIYWRILDAIPRSNVIAFLYARLCLRLEMIDEAMDMLKSLLAEGQDFSGLHRALAEACLHRGEAGEAIEEFKKAYPMDRSYIPFRCDNCQAFYNEWSDFCTACYSWNTINVRNEDFLVPDSPEIREIYEREGLSGDTETEGETS